MFVATGLVTQINPNNSISWYLLIEPKYCCLYIFIIHAVRGVFI